MAAGDFRRGCAGTRVEHKSQPPPRVTAVHRVNAVFGQGGLGVYQRIGIKQGHKEIAICRRHRLKFLEYAAS